MEYSNSSMDSSTEEELYDDLGPISSESESEQANLVEIYAREHSESESDESESGYAEPQLFSLEATESDDGEDDMTEFSGHTDSDNFTDYEREERDEESEEERDTESGKSRRIITSCNGLKEFLCFQKLPLELRLRIWELHCPALFESSRVIEVVLQRGGRLIPGPTLIRKTRPLRRFMQISRETRARGLQIVPDELAIGGSNLDDSVLRFHAKADILHFSYEEHDAILVSNRYENVQNIALHDSEVRSRRPGVYHDHINGHSVISFMSAAEVSHQTPSELRSPEFCQALDNTFPRLENVYVLENGSLRQVDSWVGANSHEEFVINTYERDEYGRRFPLRAIYCWHAPQKRRIGPTQRPRIGQEAENLKEDAADFEDGVVVNHVRVLKERGVRFSRMLFYEGEEGLETLLQMQAMCVDGKWPVDADGRPRDDDPEPYGAGWFETISEYESDGIDDDEIEEDSSDDENDDLVVDDETQILEENFSSPSPEVVGTKSDNTRGKRRRVVSDSDDSDDSDGVAITAGVGRNSRAKRRHLIAASDESDDDDDEMARPLERELETVADDEGDESAEEDEDDQDKSSNSEDDQGSKRLTLAQRLGQMGNSFSSESDSDSEGSGESEDSYA